MDEQLFEVPELLVEEPVKKIFCVGIREERTTEMYIEAFSEEEASDIAETLLSDIDFWYDTHVVVDFAESIEEIPQGESLYKDGDWT